jgi:hypothetical protein
MYNDQLLHLDGMTKERFAIDRRLIRQRRAQGARIFDGEILYLKEVGQAPDGTIRLVAGNCDYFSYATLSLRLEAELRSRFHNTPLHDTHFQDAVSALAKPLRPLGIGCSCATTFRLGNEYYVAIQNRSSEVMNLSNIRAVVPTFGLESNAVGQQTSAYSLLFYNYLKEFAEEFFDLEEVIHARTARRANPDWIFELPELARVKREVKSGRLRLAWTGISVSPFGGIVNVAMLAVSTSEAFFNFIKTTTKANWEATEGGLPDPPIEYIRLDDPRIDAWVDAGLLSANSAFALDRARQRLLRRVSSP